MNTALLLEEIKKKQSFLCVGLDVDLEKIPAHLLEEEDPIFAFNKAIIDATHKLAVAYKPNTAFYEAYGVKGWNALQKTVDYIKEVDANIFTIADAKRGDIGNTASRYAKAFFEDMGFDSVTVAPYMGSDSVEPFLEFSNKFAILLGLTSNPGAADFELQQIGDTPLYLEVIKKSATYRNSDRLMYVVGATKATYLSDIRRVIPNHFLLVPGVGAQGGSLAEVCKYGMASNVGLLVNSSRGIIYQSKGVDFAEAAQKAALELQSQMAVELAKKGF
jgi:orotidine-5'-phosphate decarboxylase